MNNSEEPENQLRRKYLDYIYYHQGNYNEPEKTYTDWSGDEILSYDMWKERFKEFINSAEHCEQHSDENNYETVIEENNEYKRIRFVKKPKE
jgi:hypothetical protein